MLLYKLNWALLVLLTLASLSPNLVRTQMSGCYFQEVNLVPCLTQPSGNTTDLCCRALNQALGAGHRCLCSLLDSANLQLASTNPLLSPPLVLTFPGCFLFSPSLAACQVPLQQLNSPPSTNTKPALTPMAIAPAPNSSHTASNSSHTTKNQLANEVPKPREQHIVPMLFFESQDGSSSSRRNIRAVLNAALICVATIYAWIL